MRAWIGFGVVVATVGIAAAVTTFGLPYSPALTVGLIGAASGAVGAACATMYARDRTPAREGLARTALLVGTAVFWGGALGGLGTMIPYRLTHATFGVVNGLTVAVAVEIDGHALVASLPSGWAREYEIPTSAKEVVTKASGQVIERANLADGGDGPGFLVYDVGANRCFFVTTLTYGGGYFGTGPQRRTFSVGTQRVFRAEVDILFNAPETVESKSKSETRTVLGQLPCDGSSGTTTR